MKNLRAPLGVIVGVLVAALLVAIAWLDISAGWLTLTFAIAILVALSIQRKRSEGRAA